MILGDCAARRWLARVCRAGYAESDGMECEASFASMGSRAESIDGWPSVSTFADHLRAAALAHPDRPALITAGGSTSWGEVDQLARQWHDRLVRPERSDPHPWQGDVVGMPMSASAAVLAALAGLEAARCTVILMDATLDTAAIVQLCTSIGCRWLLDPAADDTGMREIKEVTSPAGDVAAWAPSAEEPATEVASAIVGRASGVNVARVGVVTSGTTGVPKVVLHTWSSLFAPGRPATGDEARRWWISYRPHLYAGLQVLVQVIVEHGTLVVPPADGDPLQLAQLAARAKVTHASGTPAYWRRWVTFAPESELKQIPLRQITLGGEAADQPLLDCLHQLFPSARLTHIYATTEAGRCFAVSDGRAGFPAAWLDQPPAGIELRVVDDELWVRTSHGGVVAGTVATEGPVDPTARGGPGNWLATGDVVRRSGDRFVFDGRRGELINVGGNKVAPLKVEEVVRSVPGVSEARIYGIPSSLAGQLVGCDVVVQSGRDAEAVRQSLLEACHQRLARHEVPRVIRIVPEISTSASGKILRRQE